MEERGEEMLVWRTIWYDSLSQFKIPQIIQELKYQKACKLFREKKMGQCILYLESPVRNKGSSITSKARNIIPDSRTTEWVVNKRQDHVAERTHGIGKLGFEFSLHNCLVLWSGACFWDPVSSSISLSCWEPLTPVAHCTRMHGVLVRC